jgi:SLT domain-containing protein
VSVDRPSARHNSAIPCQWINKHRDAQVAPLRRHRQSSVSGNSGASSFKLAWARIGKGGKPETVIPCISQEMLADMVGTTRSRVSFFLNKFRKLGFIMTTMAAFTSTAPSSTSSSRNRFPFMRLG